MHAASVSATEVCGACKRMQLWHLAACAHTEACWRLSLCDVQRLSAVEQSKAEDKLAVEQRYRKRMADMDARIKEVRSSVANCIVVVIQW